MFGIVGMYYVGPLLHLNYSKILPSLVAGSSKASSSAIALKKLAFDQLVFAPCMTAGFFLVMNTLQGNPLEKAFYDIRTKFKTTMIANWQLWIPANFLNFYFIPIPYQVLWANFVSLGFNVILSSKLE